MVYIYCGYTYIYVSEDTPSRPIHLPGAFAKTKKATNILRPAIDVSFLFNNEDFLLYIATENIGILTYVLPAIYSQARSAQVNYFTALLLYISGLGSVSGSSCSPTSHSASLSLADSSERSISDS